MLRELETKIYISKESEESKSELVLLTCIKHKLTESLKKYRYTIANETKYNEQIKTVFNRMIDYNESVKIKKSYPEIISEDYSSMFSYFLDDDYGYEETDLRSDPEEFDDLISLFWQEWNLMGNKLIKIFSIPLLTGGIDLPTVLNLNQTMIVNNN